MNPFFNKFCINIIICFTYTMKELMLEYLAANQF